MRKGNELVKSKSDKKKWEMAVDRVRMIRFIIAKYFFDKERENDFLDYINSEIDLTEELALGGVKHLIVDAVSKLSKPYLMKELVKQLIDSFQYEIPPESYMIEESDNKIRMEIAKCPVRIQFNKWAKKFAPNLTDKICVWDVLAGDKIKEYGIEQKIDLTEKGCIFTFTIAQ